MVGLKPPALIAAVLIFSHLATTHSLTQSEQRPTLTLQETKDYIVKKIRESFHDDAKLADVRFNGDVLYFETTHPPREDIHQIVTEISLSDLDIDYLQEFLDFGGHNPPCIRLQTVGEKVRMRVLNYKGERRSYTTRGKIIRLYSADDERRLLKAFLHAAKLAGARTEADPFN